MNGINIIQLEKKNAWLLFQTLELIESPNLEGKELN